MQDIETDPPPEETFWRGVHKIEHWADEIYREWQKGIEPGEQTGWSCLKDHYKVKRGHWTAITGIPGHGKSTWADNLMVNLAKDRGWKFLVCSPENQPGHRHAESLIEIHSGKKFCHPNMLHEQHRPHGLEEFELIESVVFLNDHFYFIDPEETDFHLDFILELAYAIKHDAENPFDFDGILIDPWNELESRRPNAITETEYISQSLGKFRRFCRGNACHGWIIAHPTKQREVQQANPAPNSSKVYAMPSLYDISGSANWKNKADMGVVVYRNYGNKPETTTISVQKVRFRECGKIGQGELRFDYLCNRFVEHDAELLYNRSRDNNDRY